MTPKRLLPTADSRDLPTGKDDWLGIPNLQNHLVLLKAFHKTLLSVDGSIDYAHPIAQGDIASPHTYAFLAKATYRFDTWIRTSLRSRTSNAPLNDAELPPPDVLMMFHGFMLSPWLYAEDTELRFPELRNIGPFPLREVVNHIDATGEYKPTPEQITSWERQTGQPFDISGMKEAEVVCPACHTTLVTHWIVPEDGTGYGEPGFALDCKCGIRITHDVLCVNKLIRDLLEYRASERMVMRGTLFGGNVGTEQPSIARMTTKEVLRVLGDPSELGHQVSWSMSNLTKRLENSPNTHLVKALVPNLLRPYSQPSTFSVDLHFKVLRQGHFANAWVGSGFEATPTRTLEDSISRYRVFLRTEAPVLIVDQQLDLVWHTHQLLGDTYRKQSLAYAGRFLDHLAMDEFEPTADVLAKAVRDLEDSMIAEGVVPPPEPCKCCNNRFCHGCEGQTYGDGHPCKPCETCCSGVKPPHVYVDVSSDNISDPAT
ncbi:hypothetical protein FRB94_012264 [Tulasnella sp. JGI-2019a]|nr:hypothetical protein FRB93_008939 [Tulasnella sp. JGI-2019a]KAG9009317.1 hypothetical protein FRB94_012264 [Tulasnella sp. JGI-2019a]